MAIIKLKKIYLSSKKFEDRTIHFKQQTLQSRNIILNNINLEIKDGETIAILGPTGCGKTSLLKVIAGLISPSLGKIYFNDIDYTELSPKERNIGMVFQNYALYPQFTAKGNLSFKFWVKKTPPPEIENKIKETSYLLGMDFQKLLYRMPKTLSMGEKQRVALGRCIIGSPSILLFDEPLSNLDAQVRTQIKISLKKLLSKFQITTVYVTHDQHEAFTIADRIVVMNEEGGIEQIGTFDELYNHPISTQIASFIGTPPMNIFDSNIIHKTGDYKFVGIHPEDILIENKKNTIAMNGNITLIENLGTTMLIHIKVGNMSLIYKTRISKQYERNKKITIFLPKQKLFFFKQ